MDEATFSVTVDALECDVTNSLNMKSTVATTVAAAAATAAAEGIAVSSLTDSQLVALAHSSLNSDNCHRYDLQKLMKSNIHF